MYRKPNFRLKPITKSRDIASRDILTSAQEGEEGTVFIAGRQEFESLSLMACGGVADLCRSVPIRYLGWGGCWGGGTVEKEDLR